MKQGSEEWFAARLGKVTASRIVDVLAKIKTGEAATRASYRAELVAERLTGRAQEGFTTAQMRWGTESEPLARAAYEADTGLLVAEVGLIDHPEIAMAGASPDGMVSSSGLIECKCPDTKTHIETILSGSAPSKYIPQMQWQMACTGREWCDFVSFDPRMPIAQQLFVLRVERDEKYIKDTLEPEVIRFLEEVEKTVEQLLNWKNK